MKDENEERELKHILVLTQLLELSRKMCRDPDPDIRKSGEAICAKVSARLDALLFEKVNERQYG